MNAVGELVGVSIIFFIHLVGVCLFLGLVAFWINRAMLKIPARELAAPQWLIHARHFARLRVVLESNFQPLITVYLFGALVAALIGTVVASADYVPLRSPILGSALTVRETIYLLGSALSALVLATAWHVAESKAARSTRAGVRPRLVLGGALVLVSVVLLVDNLTKWPIGSFLVFAPCFIAAYFAGACLVREWPQNAGAESNLLELGILLGVSRRPSLPT